MEMAASVYSTVSKFKHSGTLFHADIHTFEIRLHNLVSMNKDLIASQHQSRRMGSRLYVRKLKNGLKEHYNTKYLDLCFKLETNLCGILNDLQKQRSHNVVEIDPLC